jgi:hypothetical protein
MLKYFVIGCFLIASNSFAQRAGLLGVGNSNCEDYLKHKEHPTIKSHYEDWMQGFLTGMNVSRIQTNREYKDLPNLKEMRAMLDLECIRDKSLTLVIAGAKIYAEMQIRKQ